MDFDVLPGPSLPELARTALARAATATVSVTSVLGGGDAARPVPVRSTRDGSPLLLPAARSPLARWLTASPDPVRVSLPAGPPFSVLRLTGTARPVTVGDEDAITACMLTIGSVEFTGGGRARVPVAEYRAARPDPLWRMAPGILRHLEDGHMGELVRCWRWPTGSFRAGSTGTALSSSCSPRTGSRRSGWPSPTVPSPHSMKCPRRCAPR
jgi:hypothetical protein